MNDLKGIAAVIRIIVTNDKASFNELLEETGLSKEALSRILRKLEKSEVLIEKGGYYIERFPN